MPLDSHLLLVGTLVVLAIISPGPDFAITVQNTLRHGRRGGVMTAAGIASGVSIHVSYCILGLGFVISQASWLLEGIRYLGAAYLIWLGVAALLPAHSSQRADTNQAAEAPPSLTVLFRQGFLCNAMNPKTCLFFVALFTQVLGPEVRLADQMILGMAIALGHLLWFGGLAALMTAASGQRALKQAQKWLTRLTGAFMVGLGARLMSAD